MEATPQKEKKMLLIFIILVFAMGWLMQGLIPLLGLNIRSGLGTTILSISMWTPALAVLILKLLNRSSRIVIPSFKPRFKGNIRWYVAIFLLTTVGFNLLISIAYFVIFPDRFNPNFMDMGLGLIIRSIVNALLLSFIIMPLTLGEEIGWRGFLFPTLRKLTTSPKAYLLCGLIWGLWHAPVIAIGYNFGTDYPFFPWLGIIGMCFFCFAFGTILSYFTSKSGSIWPAVLGHGANNATTGLFFAILLQKDAPRSDFIEAALFSLLLTVFATLLILVGKSKEKKLSRSTPAS